jgi:hypothetical protein
MKNSRKIDILELLKNIQSDIFQKFSSISKYISKFAKHHSNGIPSKNLG